MKKLLALLLTAVLIFTFAGCKKKKEEQKTDLEKIKEKGKIVIGITDYEPMNYKVDGEWTGFDTEFAKLFAKELGVEAEFVEIIWSEKYDVLDKGKIDCIWNAMTIMPNYQVDYSVSDPYLQCGQILVMKADVVGNYDNVYEIRKMRFVVEKGSAGAACMEREGFKDVKELETQYDALKAVSSGEADAAIIDMIFADTMLGEGKEFPDLARGFDYSNENCGVAFRKDSDLLEAFNGFLAEIKDDKLTELANKYGLTLSP